MTQRGGRDVTNFPGPTFLPCTVCKAAYRPLLRYNGPRNWGTVEAELVVTSDVTPTPVRQCDDFRYSCPK